MKSVEAIYRTNFFDFGDTKLIKRISKKHDVEVTTNMKGIALISKDLNKLVETIEESFNKNCKITIQNDVVFVNL